MTWAEGSCLSAQYKVVLSQISSARRKPWERSGARIPNDTRDGAFRRKRAWGLEALTTVCISGGKKGTIGLALLG